MESLPPEDQRLVPAPAPEPEIRARRWRLLRDLAVFQGKLLLDGIKDLILGPVSLIAAGVGLVFHREDPGQAFHQVMALGRSFDRWVDLFGERRRPALPAPPGEPGSSTTAPGGDGTVPSREGLDAYVSRLEQVLGEQVRRGGLTAKAKEAIDKALEAVNQQPKGPTA